MLGDFNIDMLKANKHWKYLSSSLGLKQLVTKPTHVSDTFATLIDHIYSSNPPVVKNVNAMDVSISDHLPVSCSIAVKYDKMNPKSHISIRYRCFKRFCKERFLADLAQTPFHNVYNHNSPNEALSVWYELFLAVLDKHAPMKEKRVKHSTIPPWLTDDIRKAMKIEMILKKKRK